MSITLMVRKFWQALRKALEEPDFAATLIAGGALIVTGSLFYALNEGWNLLDGAYYAVTTLTTTGNDLQITKDSSKIFTIFYILIEIGILVDVLRGLGTGFVKVEREKRERGTQEGVTLPSMAEDSLPKEATSCPRG